MSHKIKRHRIYWVLLGVFAAFLYLLMRFYTDVLGYVFVNHPEIFDHSYFKVSYATLCGLSAFVAFVVTDKYIFSKWVSLSAESA